ncbi:hypothetical protein LMG29542_02244 [Paraburkholderia humisilvae]|uniref:Uncharacterized protein n=2 Tax=Paraburkholderia humisilvae TaxID=627669 RepID=A0A6J5DKX4_9BURK|nr:hypothetical protein LMG29542_02244 [Paraburkholderia humisilvae]
MERGYKHELFLREAGFFVTLKHADSMPDTRIDAFLAVNDGGYPFLLGFVREGLGIRLVFNCYIHASLSRELQGVREVEVVEIAQGVERKYRTELLHSFD